jgi:hypothetical protein
MEREVTFTGIGSELLTMCPTGWFVPAADGPGLIDTLGRTHRFGQLKGGAL